MSEQKPVLRGKRSAMYGQISREIASSTESLTASVVAELTDAEIALVAGGAEYKQFQTR